MEFIFLSSHIIFSVKMFRHIYELHVLSPYVKTLSKDMFHLLSSLKFKEKNTVHCETQIMFIFPCDIPLSHRTMLWRQHKNYKVTFGKLFLCYTHFMRIFHKCLLWYAASYYAIKCLCNAIRSVCYYIWDWNEKLHDMLWYKISTKTSTLTEEFQECQSKIFVEKQNLH